MQQLFVFEKRRFWWELKWANRSLYRRFQSNKIIDFDNNCLFKKNVAFDKNWKIDNMSFDINNCIVIFIVFRKIIRFFEIFIKCFIFDNIERKNWLITRVLTSTTISLFVSHFAKKLSNLSIVYLLFYHWNLLIIYLLFYFWEFFMKKLIDNMSFNVNNVVVIQLVFCKNVKFIDIYQ